MAFMTNLKIAKVDEWPIRFLEFFCKNMYKYVQIRNFPN